MSTTTTRWAVGIDVGVKSAHKVAIFDRTTSKRVRRTFSVPRSWQGVRELQEILSQADQVEIAIEPADSAWRPLAGALLAFGFKVYLIDPKKSSRLRKALRDHVKSDKVDAQALARLLMLVPDELDPLRVPPAPVVRLRDIVRHRDRLVEGASARKRRIQSLVGQIQPTLMQALGQDKFLGAYRAFLRKYVDPRRVLRLGRKRLHAFLDRRYRGRFDSERTEKIFEAARSGARLLEAQETGDGPFFGAEQIQLEVAMELDLLEAEEAQIRRLETEIGALYKKLDPKGVLRTLPGFGPIIAAGVLGETGAVERFPNVGKYRGFVSLVPRHKSTGKSHNPRQKLRKAGPRLLKKYLYLAADNARRADVELAAFYARLMRKGRHHDQAVCAVANKLAGRAYAVMKRMGDPERTDGRYVYRDLHGRPISKAEARRQIQEGIPESPGDQDQHVDDDSVLESVDEPSAAREMRRPRPAHSRPPETDASSSDRGTPQHVSQVLARSGLLGLLDPTEPPSDHEPPGS